MSQEWCLLRGRKNTDQGEYFQEEEKLRRNSQKVNYHWRKVYCLPPFVEYLQYFQMLVFSMCMQVMPCCAGENDLKLSGPHQGSWCHSQNHQT